MKQDLVTAELALVATGQAVPSLSVSVALLLFQQLVAFPPLKINLEEN